MLKRACVIFLIAAIFFPFGNAGGGQARAPREAQATRLHGLQSEVRIITDKYGVPHVQAKSDRDAYFAMGYLHAKDRFFQMDYNRRRASGTLAELIGAGFGDRILNDDIKIRTIGIRRAAERSRQAVPDEYAKLIQAYADGVNAWLDKNSLPPEYTTLELSKANVPRWTILDTLTVAKSFTFDFAFDTSDMDNTATLLAYKKAGDAAGFDGAKLFFEDLFRFTPFDDTVAARERQDKLSPSTSRPDSRISNHAGSAAELIRPQTLEAINLFLEDTKDTPLFSRGGSAIGSNCWVVSGAKSSNGFAMIANDPHLSLATPPIFYEIHLTVEKGPRQPSMNVYGVSYAGVPCVILGFNEKIAWGAATSRLDVTDVYQEKVVVDPKTQMAAATLFKGKQEPVVVIAEKFRINRANNKAIDDLLEVPTGKRMMGGNVPAATVVVPRRNQGPLITTPSGPDPQNLTALSVQFTGFSPTFELEAFFIWSRAQNVDDFKRGLMEFDVGSLNFCYADTTGAIAYFTTGKVPLREDLQLGKVDGAAPFLVRDGSGSKRNEWVKKAAPTNEQSLPYETIPFGEMPQLVNPPDGFIVSANNDTAGLTLNNDPLQRNRVGGKGIYYLSARFDAGFRAGRITRLIEKQLASNHGRGKISLQDMARIQSDTVMPDAEVLTPYILQAFKAARAADAPSELATFANDKAVGEAIDRLAKWDFSTPTGIDEGYDAADENGERRPPTQEEIADSVAATIYSVWRAQILRSTIDSTLQRSGLTRALSPVQAAVSAQTSLVALKNLLEGFGVNKGRGASGLIFFELQGLDQPPDVKRDIVILSALKSALDQLAGDAFAPAFDRSTNQSDYRWGKLHRIVFPHHFAPIAPEFSIPPAAGLMNLSAGLPGISVDGGFEVIDWSGHGPRASSHRSFMFLSGPARRFIAELRPNQIKALQVIPGGESGIVGSRFFGNMMGMWLTNDFHEAAFSAGDVNQAAITKETLKPQN